MNQEMVPIGGEGLVRAAAYDHGWWICGLGGDDAVRVQRGGGEEGDHSGGLEHIVCQ